MISRRMRVGIEGRGQAALQSWAALGLGAVLGLGALSGCGDGDDATFLGGAPPLGKLRIPLDATGSSGAEYQLSASLRVSGPREETRLLSGAGPALEVALASGSYQALLLDPWQLSRIEVDGPRPVEAVLLSENPASLQIEPEATTQLVLRFRVEGGELVSGGEGALEVSVAVEDTPPGGGACDAAGSCLEPLLDSALVALGSAPGCLPAQALSTPLGNLQVCDDGAVCGDGSPGCAVAGLELRATTEVPPSGPVSLSVSAALANPVSVPVRLPALLGGGVCRLAVDAAFPAVTTSLSRVPADNGKVALESGEVDPGPAVIDVSVLEGGGFCETLVPLSEDLLLQQLQPLAGELVAGSLPALLSTLSCTECSDGCALRCAPGG